MAKAFIPNMDFVSSAPDKQEREWREDVVGAMKDYISTGWHTSRVVALLTALNKNDKTDNQLLEIVRAYSVTHTMSDVLRLIAEAVEGRRI